MQELSQKEIEIIKKECSKEIPTGQTEKLTKSQLAFYKEAINIMEIGKTIDFLSKEKLSAYSDRAQALVTGVKYGMDMMKKPSKISKDEPQENEIDDCFEFCKYYTWNGTVHLICVIVCIVVSMFKSMM
jgi:hypothetical protein